MKARSEFAKVSYVTFLSKKAVWGIIFISIDANVYRKCVYNLELTFVYVSKIHAVQGYTEKKEAFLKVTDACVSLGESRKN